MEHSLHTIREFKTAHFTVIVDAIPEYEPVDVDDDGETAQAVDNGELVHFCARVRVIHDQLGEIGSDYLGQCVYNDYDEFQDHISAGKYHRELRKQGKENIIVCTYFADMVATAIAEARAFIRSVNARPVYVRA